MVGTSPHNTLDLLRHLVAPVIMPKSSLRSSFISFVIWACLSSSLPSNILIRYCLKVCLSTILPHPFTISRPWACGITGAYLRQRWMENTRDEMSLLFIPKACQHHNTDNHQNRHDNHRPKTHLFEPALAWNLTKLNILQVRVFFWAGERWSWQRSWRGAGCRFHNRISWWRESCAQRCFTGKHWANRWIDSFKCGKLLGYSYLFMLYNDWLADLHFWYLVWSCEMSGPPLSRYYIQCCANCEKACPLKRQYTYPVLDLGWGSFV